MRSVRINARRRWLFCGAALGGFTPKPRPPFVLPKGGKSARPGSLRPRLWRGFPALLAEPGPPETRCIRYAHSAQTTGRSRCLKRAARAPDSAALLGSSNGANSRTASSWETAQLSTVRAVRLLALRYSAVAPFGSAEQRSAGGRARSALRELTRDCCLTGVSAANAGSSIPSPPERAAQGTPGAARGAGAGAALLVPFGKTKGTPGAGRIAPAGSCEPRNQSARSHPSPNASPNHPANRSGASSHTETSGSSQAPATLAPPAKAARNAAKPASTD
jgi:hypothetical protein